MHCGVTIWYFNIDQVFNWDSIYLYLVIANAILTNKLKAMLSLNHIFW
jgi:hypothetical protein